MNNTENNVAAQAGDEPIRAAFETWYNGQSNITTALRLGRFDDNGEYMSVTVEQQWQGWKGAMSSPRATADVERVTITPALRRAVDMTRADLGESGSNYPAVRELLAFAESHIATTKPGA